MVRQLNAQERVLKWLQRFSPGNVIAARQIVKELGLSRQTASRVLKDLADRKKLIKEGSTRTARYRVPRKGETVSTTNEIQLKKKLKGLSEDLVFEEASLRLNLKRNLSKNGYQIAYYAFCEMLNNAIDHSQAPIAIVDVRLTGGTFEFIVRDRGIGIFTNLKRKFHLSSDTQAIEHLLKGKQTTAPEAHSGQGLFFTSKIADRFQLKSGRFTLTFDNKKNDIHLAEGRSMKGTEVRFQIKRQTRKTLRKLFEQFANEDFEFDRTQYPTIVLSELGGFSRSQARRLTIGLDQFRRVILDFSKVKEVGQGFADEIFRVFQRQHPDMVIEVRNANAAVHFMIQRAQR